MAGATEDRVVRELDVYLCNGCLPEHTKVSTEAFDAVQIGVELFPPCQDPKLHVHILKWF